MTDDNVVAIDSKGSALNLLALESDDLVLADLGDVVEGDAARGFGGLELVRKRLHGLLASCEGRGDGDIYEAFLVSNC